MLVEITSYIQGLPYDEETFLVETKVLDGIVTDTCPPVNGAMKKYDETRTKSSDAQQNKKISQPTTTHHAHRREHHTTV